MRPRKRKWPKMTVTENDWIRLLNVIRKEAIGDCNIMVISKLAYVVVSACTMFCIVGTAHIPLLSTPVFLLFLRESWQNISRNSSFYPFHSAFNPSCFCLLKGWKVPSEPLFLASRGVFLLLSLQKNNPAFLVIFAWVMWFSVDNGDWLFRGIRSLRSRSLSVIKVFQSFKSPLRFAMKIAFTKKGWFMGKILVL